MKDYTLYYALIGDDTIYASFEFQAKNDYDALLIALLFVREYVYEFNDFKQFVINVDMDEVQNNLIEAIEELDDPDEFNVDNVGNLKMISKMVYTYMNDDQSVMLEGPTKTYNYSGNVSAKPKMRKFKFKVQY